MFGVSWSPQLETDLRPVTEQFSQAFGSNRQRLCEHPVVIGGGSKETTLGWLAAVGVRILPTDGRSRLVSPWAVYSGVSFSEAGQTQMVEMEEVST